MGVREVLDSSPFKNRVLQPYKCKMNRYEKKNTLFFKTFLVFLFFFLFFLFCEIIENIKDIKETLFITQSLGILIILEKNIFCEIITLSYILVKKS